MFFIESDAYAHGQQGLGRGAKDFKVKQGQARIGGRLVPVWTVKFIF